MRQHLWVRLLPSPLVVNVATLGPVGNIRLAPGTWGTLAGVIWFSVAYWNLNYLASLLFAFFFLYLAVQICGEAEVRLGLRDPGKIVLDEFAAVPFCFIGLQPVLHSRIAWMLVLGGFLVFRLFDVWKPFGINRLQNYPGGIGVVADDLAAALLTALVLHAAVGIAIYAGYFEQLTR